MESYQLEALEKIYYTAENGLVICDENPQTAYIAEWYHIEDKAKKLEVNAVLFRRYYDDNNNIINSKPAVYIFNDESLFDNQDKLTELHAKLWSAGDIEIYIILGKTRIDIYNARKPTNVINNNLNAEDLQLISTALEQFSDYRFSAHIFGKGLFWEQGDFYDKTKDENFFRNKLEETNTPYHQLFVFLKKIRKHLFDNREINDSNVIDKLLIICILIKFLEEIQNEDGTHTLSEIYKKYSITSFAEALIKGKSINILEKLGKQLNGKIFDYFTEKLSNENEEDFKERNNKIKEKLRNTDLSPIADFLLVRLNKETGELDFNLDTKQIKFNFPEFKWSQYSFRHLPIELISSIYEHFLQEDAIQLTGSKEKGVVYTPPFLVSFLIDEVMPLDKYELFKNEQFKILDPSCGSGIFLVSAYKRLLQWWIVNDSKNNNNQLPQKFNAKIFQDILENNIYGVDINPKATLISIFSLTITFLDKLTPVAFWQNLNFNKLRQNIQNKDFFEWASTQEKGKFSRTIGNPPFNGENNQSSVKIADDLIDKIGFKHKKVPGNKFALQFFEASMTLSQKTCLIIPSNNLLYNNSDTSNEYRKSIFTDFTVEKIFDFTHLRRELFGNADTAVCAIIAQNKPSEQQTIEHIIIKRMISTEKKTTFEIDHYDRHFVRWDCAIDETKQFVWKTNLLGGGRLFQLINRLSMLENLGDFLLYKEKNNKWFYLGGYRLPYKSQTVESVPASFITKKPTIKANSFDEFGNYTTIPEEKEEFAAPRNKELYEPPHIIFKLVVEDNKIPMAYVEDYLCFNSSFVGISAPPSDKEDLYQIYERLYKNEKLSNLYRAFILATSSKAIIYRGDVMTKEDIDNLPYPENTDYLEPSEMEEIIINDVLKYQRHLQKATDKGAKDLSETTSQEQLKSYGEVFCKVVNSIYEQKDEQSNLIQKWQIGKVEQTPNFTFYQFVYGAVKPASESFNFKKVDFSELDEVFKPLIENKEENRSAIYSRVVRLYDYKDGYDCVFFVKPNAMRYWLDSIALRDADDTIFDYYKAGF